MSCNDQNTNNSWGDILDSEIVYTGLPSQCDFLEITPGMKLRDVMNILATAICVLSEGEEPIPNNMIEDDTLTILTTGDELNSKYPNSVNGTIIYNGDEKVQFTKYPTGWKFEVIEIR